MLQNEWIWLQGDHQLQWGQRKSFHRYAWPSRPTATLTKNGLHQQENNQLQTEKSNKSGRPVRHGTFHFWENIQYQWWRSQGQDLLQNPGNKETNLHVLHALVMYLGLFSLFWYVHEPRSVRVKTYESEFEVCFTSWWWSWQLRSRNGQAYFYSLNMY